MVKVIPCVGIVLCTIYGIKNFNTPIQRKRIIDAIGAYHIALIDNNLLYDSQVEYSDMESYEKTLLRIWDWGYTNILPKEKFEIIKKYMK